jgi:serine/threonine protein kinase
MRPPITRPYQLSTIALQVAEGMQFLHSNGIVHCDLKTKNILIDENLTATIADFGLAGIMKDHQGPFGGVGTPTTSHQKSSGVSDMN